MPASYNCSTTQLYRGSHGPGPENWQRTIQVAILEVCHTWMNRSWRNRQFDLYTSVLRQASLLFVAASVDTYFHVTEVEVFDGKLLLFPLQPTPPPPFETIIIIIIGMTPSLIQRSSPPFRAELIRFGGKVREAFTSRLLYVISRLQRRRLESVTQGTRNCIGEGSVR